MKFAHPNTPTPVWTLIGLSLAIASGASAQISSINSAVLAPRFFNDFPSAGLTMNNSYPGSITYAESGAWRTNSGGLNRDVWNFSNNGSTIYTLGANDFFTASMTVNVTGTTTVDNEAGFIVQNLNGNFPGGDLQFIADPQSHFLGMFGGTGFWNSGFSYNAGDTVTLGMTYFFDTANSQDAFQFWVTDGGTTATSPVQDWGNNVAGDTFGGYYQIGNGGSSPGASGQAVFGNITIAVPEPSMLALFGLGIPLLVRQLRRRA
jgi:hypothetical protein